MRTKVNPVGAGSRPAVTNAQVETEASKREAFTFQNPEDEARANAAIAQADSELAAKDAARVNFRWEVGPLDIVRQAAELSGMSYQNWIKHTLYQQAVKEIAAAKAVDPRASRPTRA